MFENIRGGKCCVAPITYQVALGEYLKTGYFKRQHFDQNTVELRKKRNVRHSTLDANNRSKESTVKNTVEKLK